MLRHASQQEREEAATLRLQLNERDDMVARLHEHIQELKSAPAATSDDDMQVDDVSVADHRQPRS